jgi:Ca-activated chloride channel family protein
MSFGAPIWLVTLLLIPAAIVISRAARRRTLRYAVRFPAAVELLEAAAAAPAWPRRLPAALALLSVAFLSVAMAKPTRTVRVPIEQASIVLVTDHSGSMQATDVAPTRLAAAQQAAQTFIDKLPSAVRVGTIAFSGQPDAVQAPTTDHDAARVVIASQIADGATATGDALQAAIELLRRDGKHPPSAIVLLSDGATTAGRDPVEVAQEARRQHIPIYTVALGTYDATVPNPDPFGPPLSAAPDPDTLRRIAHTTGATAFTADDPDRLTAIYRRLGSQLGSHLRQREMTAFLAVMGLLSLLAAAGLAARRVAPLP